MAYQGLSQIDGRVASNGRQEGGHCIHMVVCTQASVNRKHLSQYNMAELIRSGADLVKHIYNNN
jgi:hypothetical protein